MVGGYTNVFGGDQILPSNVSYQAIALAANLSLSWPTEDNASGNIVAYINDVNPGAPGLSITMPSALNVSPGVPTTFNNVGASTFTVKDNLGNTILTVSSGTIWCLYLTDNSTQQGTWRAYQLGAAVSAVNAAALAGAGLTAIGTQLNQVIAVTTLNASGYNAGAPDLAKMFNWTGGGGVLNLPLTGTVGNSYYLQFRNSGSGGLALTPNVADNINGQTAGAVLSLQPGDSCFLITDGVGNWITVGLGRTVTFSFDFTSVDVSGTGVFTLSGANLNRISYRLTGVLTGARHVQVPATVQQYWIDNNTTGAFVLDVATAAQITPVVIPAGNRFILYCDGTNVVNADTQTFVFPIAIAQGGTGATTASNARTNLGATSIGNTVFTTPDTTTAQIALDVYSRAASDSNAIAFAVALG